MLCLPESTERIHLQTPNKDTSCDDDQTECYALLPRHDFFSLDAGALITISGRVESAGAAAFLGAPDSMAGDYVQGDAALAWDADLVNQLQGMVDYDSVVEYVNAYLAPQAAQQASALGD